MHVLCQKKRKGIELQRTTVTRIVPSSIFIHYSLQFLGSLTLFHSTCPVSRLIGPLARLDRMTECESSNGILLSVAVPRNPCRIFMGAWFRFRLNFVNLVNN